MASGRPPESFYVPREDWVSGLAALAPVGKPRTLWVLLTSRILTLFATPCQVQANEQGIHLLIPQQSPDDPPRIEIEVVVPEEGRADFERRVNENGDMRFSMTYAITRGPGREFPSPLQWIIATSKEFLMIADSEVHVQ